MARAKKASKLSRSINARARAASAAAARGATPKPFIAGGTGKQQLSRTRAYIKAMDRADAKKANRTKKRGPNIRGGAGGIRARMGGGGGGG